MQVLGTDAELGCNVNVGLELLKHLAQVLLRQFVAIGGSRVEVVDAQRESVPYRAHLLLVGAADHHSAHVAAAEADLRHADSRTAKRPIPHMRFHPPSELAAMVAARWVFADHPSVGIYTPTGGSSPFWRAGHMNGDFDPEGVETGLLHNLVDFAGKDVLEIGCGEGRMTWRYASTAASVLAFDLDEPSIATAREQTPETLRRSVEFRVAGVMDIGLADSAYDVAILSWSI